MQFLWGPSNMFQYISIATATVLHNDLADIIAWVHRYAWYAYGAVHSNLTVLDPILILRCWPLIHTAMFLLIFMYLIKAWQCLHTGSSFDFLLIQFCWAGNNQVWGWFIKISQKRIQKFGSTLRKLYENFLIYIYIHIYLQYNNHQVEVKVQVHLQVLNL